MEEGLDKPKQVSVYKKEQQKENDEALLMELDAPFIIPEFKEDLDQELSKRLPRVLNTQLSKQKVSEVKKVVFEASITTIRKHEVQVVSHDNSRDLLKDEQNQRHKWEDRNSWFQFIYAMTSIILGFGVSVSLIIGAIHLATIDHDAVATALVAASAVGMVSAFVKAGHLFNPKREAAPVSNRPKVKQTTSRRS